MSENYYFNLTSDGQTFLSFDPNTPDTGLVSLTMNPLLNAQEPMAKGQIWFTSSYDFQNEQILCKLGYIRCRLSAAPSEGAIVVMSTQQLDDVPYNWTVTEEGYLMFNHRDYIVGPDYPQLYAVKNGNETTLSATPEVWQMPAVRELRSNIDYAFIPVDAPEKYLTSTVAGSVPELSADERAMGQDWRILHASNWGALYNNAQFKSNTGKWLAGSDSGALTMVDAQPANSWTIVDYGDETCSFQYMADGLTELRYLTLMDDNTLAVKKPSGNSPSSKQKWKFSSPTGKGINNNIDIPGLHSIDFPR